MREEYLWKGSKGHFPFPSSCFPSSLSCPFTNVCRKQSQRERKERKESEKTRKSTILYTHRAGTQGWIYRTLAVVCVSQPINHNLHTYLHYYSPKYYYRYIKIHTSFYIDLHPSSAFEQNLQYYLQRLKSLR